VIVKHSFATLTAAVATTWLAHVSSAVHAKLSVKNYIQLTINGVLKDFIKQG
jgi:hypothetical protein